MLLALPSNVYKELYPSSVDIHRMLCPSIQLSLATATVGQEHGIWMQYELKPTFESLFRPKVILDSYKPLKILLHWTASIDVRDANQLG